MKILLDVEDEKASFIMEVLKNFKYVKSKPLTHENSVFLNELEEAVEEVKLIKAGKAKGRPAEQLLDEL